MLTSLGGRDMGHAEVQRRRLVVDEVLVGSVASAAGTASYAPEILGLL